MLFLNLNERNCIKFIFLLKSYNEFHYVIRNFNDVVMFFYHSVFFLLFLLLLFIIFLCWFWFVYGTMDTLNFNLIMFSTVKLATTITKKQLKTTWTIFGLRKKSHLMNNFLIFIWTLITWLSYKCHVFLFTKNYLHKLLDMYVPSLVTIYIGERKSRLLIFISLHDKF